MDDWRSYDRTAETYERIHAPRFVEPARDLVALAGVRAGAKVLDVGTGTGVAAEVARDTRRAGGRHRPVGGHAHRGARGASGDPGRRG